MDSTFTEFTLIGELGKSKVTSDAETTLALIEDSIHTELGSNEKRSIQCSISANGIVESTKERLSSQSERKQP